jgi:hypothetical protein
LVAALLLDKVQSSNISGTEFAVAMALNPQFLALVIIVLSGIALVSWDGRSTTQGHAESPHPDIPRHYQIKKAADRVVTPRNLRSLR